MTARTVTVNCAAVQDEAGFWAAYMRDGPDIHPGFGRNLDAFRDALWGGPGWPDADEVRFTNSDSLGSLRGGTFVQCLEEIAREVNSVRLVFS